MFHPRPEFNVALWHIKVVVLNQIKKWAKWMQHLAVLMLYSENEQSEWGRLVSEQSGAKSSWNINSVIMDFTHSSQELMIHAAAVSRVNDEAHTVTRWGWGGHASKRGVQARKVKHRVGGWGGLAKPELWVTSLANLWTSWGGAMTIRAGDDWLWGYRNNENRGDGGKKKSQRWKEQIYKKRKMSAKSRMKKGKE